MGKPARGYTWPPFEPDNTAALTHGATSERKWRPIAEQLAADMLREAPWLCRQAFSLAVAAWAATEAKAALVDRWLDEHGLLTDDGDPRPANSLSDRLHARAITLRSQLGFDPVSFAKLLATFAGVPGGEDALSALKAEGARLVEARSAALPAGTAEEATYLPTGAEASAQRHEEAT